MARASIVWCVAVSLSFALLASGCRKRVTESAFQLENGLRVQLLSTPQGDKAALALLYDIGADQDPPGRSGMTRLVERLIRTKLGHDWQARTGADYTLHAVVAPVGRLTEEIDAAALAMSHTIVTDGALAAERPALLSDVASLQERDALSAAMTRAAEAVRPSRGGGVRGGIANEIDALTPNEVEAFWRMHYGAATARLVIVGPIDVEAIAKRVRESFAGVPAGKTPPARPPAGSSVTGTLVMGDAPTAAALAVPVPAPKDPLYPAFLVLAARVTAAGDPAARKWRGDFDPLLRPDVLFVTTALAPGEPGEAAAARMRAQVNAVVTAPLAADEPARAIEKYGAALGLAPPAAEPYQAAVAAGRRAQLGVDSKALAQAITPEQLAAAARLFDGKNSAAVLAGGK